MARREFEPSPSRRKFIKKNALALMAFYLPVALTKHLKHNTMMDEMQFDVIIVGGSYSGLAAGMALGRALKRVLLIDSGEPCNRQTPYSHNFLTQDGRTPKEIAMLGKRQVENYDTVTFVNDIATKGVKTKSGFEIHTLSGNIFSAKKIIFATGIKDIMPAIDGFDECWGISVLHCPYCHGYEVRNERTGVLGNGEKAYEFAALISNWTKDLTLFTNGKSTLTTDQIQNLRSHGIETVETEIERLDHTGGQLQQIIFKGGTTFGIKAMYAPRPFVQHCDIPATLGCELTEEGYLRVDSSQQTSIQGIYACGDNVTRLRTVANAVAMGTTAGMMVNKEMVFEGFGN